MQLNSFLSSVGGQFSRRFICQKQNVEPPSVIIAASERVNLSKVSRQGRLSQSWMISRFLEVASLVSTTYSLRVSLRLNFSHSSLRCCLASNVSNFSVHHSSIELDVCCFLGQGAFHPVMKRINV